MRPAGWSITQAEVTKTIKPILSGKALGVDKICLQFPKSLDVVGLVLVTPLRAIEQQSGMSYYRHKGVPGVDPRCAGGGTMPLNWSA